VQIDAKLALLLGKYDAKIALASGGARQQVDAMVDDLFERIVVCSMLDPPSKHMSCFMFNVDTHEFETYPEGWWAQVVQVCAAPGRVYSIMAVLVESSPPVVFDSRPALAPASVALHRKPTEVAYAMHA
jgi:hypothetical protein